MPAALDREVPIKSDVRPARQEVCLLSLLVRGRATTALRHPNRAGDGAVSTRSGSRSPGIADVHKTFSVITQVPTGLEALHHGYMYVHQYADHTHGMLHSHVASHLLFNDEEHPALQVGGGNGGLVQPRGFGGVRRAARYGRRTSTGDLPEPLFRAPAPTPQPCDRLCRPPATTPRLPRLPHAQSSHDLVRHAAYGPARAAIACATGTGTALVHGWATPQTTQILGTPLPSVLVRVAPSPAKAATGQ